jgi:CBS domain-containing protein
MSISQLLAHKGSDVITIRPEATIADAVALMKEKQIGALVVSSDGSKIAGILSERDIVRALDSNGPGLLKDTVGAIMTRLVVTCRPGSSLDDIMELMTNGRFRHVPIVDDGRLAGIISIGDAVKAKLEELQGQTESLRQYIAVG